MNAPLKAVDSAGQREAALAATMEEGGLGHEPLGPGFGSITRP